MPAELGGAVLRQCLETAERILSAGPAECFGNEPGGVETGEVGKWYRGLEMTCPLLSDGLCTRYEQRPTVCREHIVMGSSLACRVAGTEESLGDGSHIAIMPVSVVQALGQLTAELEGTDVEAVMLPLALPWAEGNLERGRRTWPAKVIVERFVEILREMGS